MTDENRILRAVLNGDQDAFRQLYQLYSDKVYNTAISYTQNEEDAEEVTQDVFLNVHRTAHQFQFNSSISTWVYRITVNKSLDFLRKKNTAKRKGAIFSLYKKDSSEIKYDSKDFVHPGIKLENQENATILFQMIDTLVENQKTAFILTHVEDLSYKEAAAIMDTSRKAVESLIQRAKGNLRKKLEKIYPERGV